MIGTTIAHYTITDKIGQGGMGEVYLAEDTKLERKVALKFLPDSLHQDPVAEKRFLREAKSAAALDHPFICNIYEAGQENGKSYISMEYVQGENLKDKLENDPLLLKEALEMATEIAQALETAHKANIVHRDLKPSNIMLTSDGHVQVMDFGLAKQLFPSKDVETQEQAITASLTKTGMTLGTLAYMSPEQLRGAPVDTRSDVFSFGILLFEMITGIDPFRKSQPMETASAILKDNPPPLSRYLNDAPPFLERVVGKMLAKEPGQGYQLVHDVGTDLQQLVREIAEPTQSGHDGLSGTSGQMTTSTSPGSWQQIVPWSIASLVIGAIITSVVFWSPAPTPPPQPLTRLPLPLPPTQRLSAPARHQVAFSPDGTHLVYAADFRLYLRPMDQMEATPICGTAEGEGTNPFFSPDGEWVGFYTRGQLNKVSITGGAPVMLCEAGRPWGASWGADDRIVFGQGAQGIFQVPANGGEKELLISVDPEKNEFAHGPQILPGGNVVLFTLSSGSGWNDAQIVAQAVGTAERKVLVNGGTDARYVSTGHLVYVQEGTLLAVLFDVEAWKSQMVPFRYWRMSCGFPAVVPPSSAFQIQDPLLTFAESLNRSGP